ncbi:MAG: hypothetical protein WA584_03660 [Pyrinomonadaceae bacterium]
MKLKLTLFTAFVVLSCVFTGAVQSEAQTSKKKKKTTRTTVTPTPVSKQQTLPLIISRADEFPAQDQPIVTETQPAQTENSETKTENTSPSAEELDARIKSLESSRKNDYDTKQKRLLMNLDILTRAETRAETLRKQLFEMIEKQNELQIKIDQINSDLQPAMIERFAAYSGSMRPEQLREARQKSLESEKRNLESLSTQVEANRKSLEDSVFKADYMVQKLRSKLEKEIDDALVEKEDK